MEEILKLVSRAREGDKDAQKILFDECLNCSLPLSIQNIKNTYGINLNYFDLRDLVSPAFLRAIRTFDKEKGNFIDYFKYIYMQETKTLIQRHVNYYKRQEQLSIVEEKKKYEIYEFHCSDYYKNGESRFSHYDLEKLRSEVRENKMNLTKKEQGYIQQFLSGLNMKEISENAQKNYTETVRTIKKAIMKIRSYFDCENF